MKHRDHNAYRELLYLEGDGELTTAERAALHRHLPRCGECRRARVELERLDQVMASGRVPVREGFRDEILAALPPAGWEAAHPRYWIASLALFLGVGGTAAALLSSGGGEVSSLPLAGAFGAVFDLLRSAMLAGGGLLAASWKGMGMAVEKALDGSTLSWVAFGAVILGIDILFLRFLMRSAEPSAAGGEKGRPPSG